MAVLRLGLLCLCSALVAAHAPPKGEVKPVDILELLASNPELKAKLDTKIKTKSDAPAAAPRPSPITPATITNPRLKGLLPARRKPRTKTAKEMSTTAETPEQDIPLPQLEEELVAKLNSPDVITQGEAAPAAQTEAPLRNARRGLSLPSRGRRPAAAAAAPALAAADASTPQRNGRFGPTRSRGAAAEPEAAVDSPATDAEEPAAAPAKTSRVRNARLPPRRGSARSETTTNAPAEPAAEAPLEEEVEAAPAKQKNARRFPQLRRRS